MSKKVAIVGSGQAGLQLAFSLLANGYTVTVVSDRTPEQIETGKISATAALFWRGQEYERALGLNYWDDKTVRNEKVALDVRGADGARLFGFTGHFRKGVGLFVDLRLKYATWLRELERRGGRVVIEKAGVPEIEELAKANDLVFVGVGRGTSELFERDAERSVYAAPRRSLGVAIVRRPWEKADEWAINIVPGVGELCAAPLLAAEGVQTRALLAWGVPGSTIDFSGVDSGQETLARLRSAFERYSPEQFALIEDKPLLDANSWIAGAVTPVVRKALGRLPSGKPVIALGDTLVTVDPISANGLNNATYAAHLFAERIVQRGDRPFDEAWVESVAGEFWDHARHAYALQAALLDPPEHIGEVLQAASGNQALADDILSSYPDPPSVDWLYDAQKARAHVQRRVASQPLAATA
jgi:2-polyprenyl-6-methoxyphenol hydroxylase-like FAD-dependent oxidoreductase